jgi:hypothetical protein
VPDLNPEAYADSVVLAIKSALGPILERLAAIETRVSPLIDLRDRVLAAEAKSAVQAIDPELAALQNRVLAIETKSAQPMRDQEVLERLAVVEANTERVKVAEQTVTELRDRVVMVETKAAIPPPPDQAVGELRDRVLALETKAAIPVPAVLEAKELVLAENVTAVRDRLVALETKTAAPDTGLADLRERVVSLEGRMNDAPLTKELGALRERVAVVEVRAQVPGPAGKDGQNGRDGVDGIGFDDLAVAHDGERAFTFTATRGDRVKDLGTFTVPLMINRGVYLDGKSYERGDVVTWAGSQWHANEVTATKPGDGSKAWTLVVKRGRDGRDGVDAHPAVPVVSVGRTS